MNFFSMPSRMVRRLIHLWPPLWFTGIRFVAISDDYRNITARMGLYFYNKNIIGIQYGGNLFSMTDPCYMMMLRANLGRDYYIVDQAASIEFIRPGISTVWAKCQLVQDDIDHILKHTLNGQKYLKQLSIDIVDDHGEIIALVQRTIYIRKKPSRYTCQKTPGYSSTGM